MKIWLSAIAILLVYVGLILASSGEDPSGDDSSGEDSSEYGVVDGDVGTNCTCGFANKEGERIIGGEESKRNEWPMIAEMSVMGEHFCGGTIVTNRHIVTAAHCAFFPKSLDKLPYEKIDVYVGIHEVRGVKAFEGGQHYSIEEFVAHPKYHYIGKTHDIAVILVDSEMDFSNGNVARACLPLGDENFIGDNLKVLGWGLEQYRAEEGSSALMKVDLKAVGHEMCQGVYKYYNTDTNICVFKEKKDACQGDSGGPALWRDPKTNRYHLVGATSYGRRCGQFAGVYAKISYFLSWIQSTISDTDPTQKTCAKLSS